MNTASRKLSLLSLLRPVLCGALCACILLASGCSFLAPSTQPVTLRASDPDARLFINGREVGTGEAVVNLRRNGNYHVRAETEDGRFANARLNRQIGTVGWVDLLGGVLFIVPWAGVLAPGFWSLDRDFVQLDVPRGGDRGPAARPAAERPPVPEPWRAQ